MKWWHAVLGIIGIAIVSAFVVPPSIRCKFIIWDSQACTKIQQGTELLKTVGLDLNPDEPIITQIDELAQGFKRTPVNRF